MSILFYESTVSLHQKQENNTSFCKIVFQTDEISLVKMVKTIGKLARF